MMKKIMLIGLLILIILAFIFTLINPFNPVIEQATVARETTNTVNNDGVQVDPRDIIHIRENMFITQVDDIYTNREAFEGQIVAIEGLFASFIDLDGSTTYTVGRRTPGCCHPEGWSGFVIEYDGVRPEELEWIKVIGEIELFSAFLPGHYEPMIRVISLEVKENRGLEFVTR